MIHTGRIATQSKQAIPGIILSLISFRVQSLIPGTFRKKFPGVPCVALTATATPHVVDDILTSLSLKKPVAKFQTPCFRKNLFYDVKFTQLIDDPYADLKAFALHALNTDAKEDPSTIDWVSFGRTR